MKARTAQALKSIRRVLSRKSVRLLIGLALLVILLSLIDFEQTWQAMRDVKAWGILLLIAFFYLGHTLASWRWQLLLRAHEVRITLWDAFRLNLIAMFTSCFLPGIVGGDALKMAVLVRRGNRLSRVVAASVMDRVINTLVVSLWVLVMLPRVLQVIDVDWHQTGIRILPLLAIAATVFLCAAAIGLWVLFKTAWGQRLRHRGGEHLRSLSQIVADWRRHPGTFVIAVVSSALMFAILTGGAYALLAGLGAVIGFLDVLAVFLALHFISIVPISINGLGITELSIVVLLGALGIPAHTAAAFAILFRATSFLCLAPAGLICATGAGDLKPDATPTPH